jgi:antitoxin FitA
MAQILVRNLDAEVVKKLKLRARKNHRSLQAELKIIIDEEAESLAPDREQALKKLLKLRRQFQGRKFPDSGALIREDRDR